MSSRLDEEWQRTPRWVPSSIATTARAMRVDLEWLHAAWMSIAYSEGLGLDYSVVDHQRPTTTLGVTGYRLWAVVGLLVLLVVYPSFVLGLATRYYARRIDRITAGLGFIGVALVSLVVWGSLTAVTYVSAIAFEGFVAVGVAGLVATASAVLALYVSRLPGRASTVLVGYPLAVTAFFLPPVVASLYSPTLAAIVFPSSESLAIWILDNLLSVGGLAAFIRATFELEGLAYVGMWFFLAVPTGWFLGAVVALANRVIDSRSSDAAAGFY